jgi:hypothetical protein
MSDIVRVWCPFVPHTSWRRGEVPDNIVYIKLSCDTTVMLRPNTKPAQGHRLRIPRNALVNTRRTNNAHWEETVTVLRTLGVPHLFYPRAKPICVRLQDTEALLNLKLATGLPQIEEYLEGPLHETPSLLCEWFGITVPRVFAPTKKKKRGR